MEESEEEVFVSSEIEDMDARILYELKSNPDEVRNDISLFRDILKLLRSRPTLAGVIPKKRKPIAHYNGREMAEWSAKAAQIAEERDNFLMANFDGTFSKGCNSEQLAIKIKDKFPHWSTEAVMACVVVMIGRDQKKGKKLKVEVILKKSCLNCKKCRAWIDKRKKPWERVKYNCRFEFIDRIKINFDEYKGDKYFLCPEYEKN